MKSERNHIYNLDCMLGMAEMPDDYIDLAIVDPPYGVGISSNPVRQQHEKKQWDNEIPQKNYFIELMRVSKNQIIWGGNYFLDYLGNTQGFLIWDKKQPHDFSLAMCELAWMSFQSPAKIFRYSVLAEKWKQHPTQKPVKLYKWLLTNYAKESDLILDTHMGSGSSYIACLDMSFDYIGYEIDTDYFKAIEDRVYHFTRQTSLL